MNVHPVRACSQPFVCGGDDYLFVLFDGSCKVRATSSPAAALAAAAAAIVALLLCSVLACACLCAELHALCPWPSQAVDCGFTHAATGSRGGGWQVANSKVAFCHSLSSGSVRSVVVCVWCCVPYRIVAVWRNGGDIRSHMCFLYCT